MTILLPLTLSLIPAAAAAADERSFSMTSNGFIVGLFTSYGPNGSRPVFEKWLSFPTTPKRITYMHEVEIDTGTSGGSGGGRRPCDLHFWLYSKELATGISEKIWCEKFIGSGRCSLLDLIDKSEVTIELFPMQQEGKENTENDSEGVMNISTTLSASEIHTIRQSVTRVDSAYLSNRGGQKLIDHTESTFHRLMNQGYTLGTDIYFAYMRSTVGLLPISAFAYLSRCVQPPPPDVNGGIEQLMRTVCMGTDAIVGYSFTTALNDKDKGEYIGEMLTVLTRTMLYQLDRAHAGGEIVDEWLRINCFPHPAEAAFDCEDGAEVILEWIHLWLTTELLDPSLRLIARWMKQYTPCLVIGKLKDQQNDTYVAHVYTAMFDTRWFDQQLNNPTPSPSRSRVQSFLPSIILESTSYTECCWATPLSDDDSQCEQYEKAAELFDKDEVFKTRCPIPTLARQRMYGEVSSLLSAHYVPGNGHEPRMIHVVLKDEKKKTIGASPIDVFCYHSDVRMATVINEPISVYEQRDIPWTEFPCSQFPSPISANASRANAIQLQRLKEYVEQGVLMYFISARAMKAYKQWITRTMKKLENSYDYRVNIVSLLLAKDIEMCVICVLK